MGPQCYTGLNKSWGILLQLFSTSSKSEHYRRSDFDIININE